MATKKPFGSWPSVISSQRVASAAPNLNHIQSHGEHLFWVENRPLDAGRNIIVSRNAQGVIEDLLPSPYSHYSRVHEYGGMAYAVANNTLYFVNAVDQRIYQLEIGSNQPVAITESGPRFADLLVDSRNQRLIAVCEQHSDQGEVENYLAGIPLDKNNTQLQRLASGADFYAYPAISPDGRKLCWIEWNHPHMPWDSTQLWRAELQGETLSNKTLVSGSDGNEAIFQPQWSPDNQLYFVSDRNNWWNIYSADSGIVLDMPAEFATPLWQFGMSTYDFMDATTIGCLWAQQGTWHCGTVDLATGKLNTIDCPFSAMESVCCHKNTLYMVASAPTIAKQIIAISQPRNVDSVHAPCILDIAPDNLAMPESIGFPTANGELVQAFFYPPTNSLYRGEDQELPPVIAICHGGPTGATDSGLNLKIQYWANRGFAVVDINYRGSTGFGRDYRHALTGAWGVADVEDTEYAIKYLVAQHRVDPDRCIIRGSSAGGYTVLSALTFTDTFKAGASLYGIGDLETLVGDTHKFESRYLDNLVGPYPERKDIYRQRSPIHHIDQLNCPVIFLQGLEDKVVPPNQAQMMVESLQQKGVEVMYIKFPDEGHGFRKAENIIRAMEAELAFYCDLFNLSEGN